LKCFISLSPCNKDIPYQCNPQWGEKGKGGKKKQNLLKIRAFSATEQPRKNETVPKISTYRGGQIGALYKKKNAAPFREIQKRVATPWGDPKSAEKGRGEEKKTGVRWTACRGY